MALTGINYSTRTLNEILGRSPQDGFDRAVAGTPIAYTDNAIESDTVPAPASGLAQTAAGTGGVNLSAEQFSEWMKQNRQGSTPPWLRNTMALGNLGLGIASFLDTKKTAKLQRESLRHNLDVAREEQAQRQAVRDSWNNAWGQS